MNHTAKTKKLFFCTLFIIMCFALSTSALAASKKKKTKSTQVDVTDARAALDEGGSKKKIKTIGGAKLSKKNKSALQSAIRSLSPYTAGIVLVDLKNGKGLVYNADQMLYSASTLKGPYVASLVSARPSTLYDSKSSIDATIVWSSNDHYRGLIARYGNGCMKNWCAEAGIRKSLANEPFTMVTARELAKLWLKNYVFFNSSSTGSSLGSLYTHPNLSVLHSVLGGKYKTQTKAGWIAESGYRRATNDAGIIYAKDPYLVVILTNVPWNFGRLSTLVRTLDKIAGTFR